jgi:hypothetical protein
MLPIPVVDVLLLASGVELVFMFAFMGFSFSTKKQKNWACQLRSARAGRLVAMAPLRVMPLRLLPFMAPEFAVLPFVAAGAVVVSFMAPLARCMGDGAVRTTVAVSLRGTACRLAVAASCGVTPTVAGADAPVAGMGVCAEALAIATAINAPREINLI